MFLFFFASISLMLIGGVQGASIAKSVPVDNCTVAETYHTMSCAFRMLDFGEKIEELNIDNKSEMKEFKKSCETLNNCFESIGHCRAFNDEQGRRAFDMAKIYCGIITFIAESFKECDDKLVARNSTCYYQWDPFLDEGDFKDEKKKNEACKNYFGKEQCLKKEVIKECSQKEWERLRDTLITLNNETTKHCDFDNII